MLYQKKYKVLAKSIYRNQYEYLTTVSADSFCDALEKAEIFVKSRFQGLYIAEDLKLEK